MEDFVPKNHLLRKTAEEIEMNAAYRWFLEYSMNEKTPHFATLTVSVLYFSFCIDFFTKYC